MKEIPILFKSEMVRAILDGRKTVTRRIVKPQPLTDQFMPISINKIKHKYGKAGDKLWVRETWARIFEEDGCFSNNYTGIPDIDCPIGCKGCHYEYRADIENKYPGEWPAEEGTDPKCPKWKPSIFMPRNACRLFLLNESVTIERLQSITNREALKEGIKKISCGYGTDLTCMGDTAREAYKNLWNSINTKRGFPWNSNPWVWRIKFREI